MTFQIKQGDTKPAYVVALKDNFGEEDEAAIDLTTADTVTFKMRESGNTGAPLVNGTASINAPATSGIVTYNWGTADLDTVGTYDAEFEITWNPNEIETVPNGEYLTIEVIDDLDA